MNVDLGPEKSIRNRLRLKSGDRIIVYGHNGRVNGQATLIAHKIDHDGNIIALGPPTAWRSLEFEGTILAMEHMKLRGDGDRWHTVADVRTNDGTRRLVSLGTQQRVGDMGIQPGDRVEVTVRPCRINGNTGFVAERIRHDGSVFLVNAR